MKTILSFLIIFFQITLGISQLEFETTQIDFGELKDGSERYRDIRIKNQGNKKAYILNYTNPKEVACLYTNKGAEKDSVLIFRVQPNPKNLGRFSYDISVYTSDKSEPTILHITGVLKEHLTDPLARMQACPTFNDRPTQNATDFKLHVEVYDNNSKEPIANASVLLIQNGIKKAVWKTNEDGKVSKDFPLGFTYFYVVKKGYNSSEKGQYVNIKDNIVTIYLDKIIINNTDYYKEEIKKYILVETKKEDNKIIDSIVVKNEVKLPLDSIPLKRFDDTHFNPVNVTFVIDISSSMRIGDRMELMKFSLLELASMLREQDKISIVSYATEADVILKPVNGVNKEQLQKVISTIKAGGMTAGGEGIKLGCKTNNHAFLVDGVNLVYIITDGAFNKSSKDYIQSLDEYKSKGMIISVVGIQNSPTDAINMQQVAVSGGGDYLSIQKLADAEKVLLLDIKKRTYKF
jgi:Ca-activated chloride channel family protein